MEANDFYVEPLPLEEISSHSESFQSNTENSKENENNVHSSVSSLPESNITTTDEIENENIILIPRLTESKDTLIAIENNELLLREAKRNLNDETNLKPKLSHDEMIEIIDFEKDFEIEGELTSLPGNSTNNVNSIIIKRKMDSLENNENKISNSQNFLPFKKRYIPPVLIKPKKITRKKKATTTKNYNRVPKKIGRPIFEPSQNHQNIINMIDRPIEIEILSQAQVNEISSTQISPPHYEIIRQPPPPPPPPIMLQQFESELESEQENHHQQQQQIIESQQQEEESESEQDITPQKQYENLTVDLYYDSAFTDVELLAENIVKKQITEDLSKERKRKQQHQQRKQPEKTIINEFGSTTSNCSSSCSSSSNGSICNNPGPSNNRIKHKNNRKKNLKTEINNVQGEQFFRSQAGTDENSNDEFRTRLAETTKNESDTIKKLFRALMEKEKKRISTTNETIDEINEKIKIEKIKIIPSFSLYTVRKNNNKRVPMSSKIKEIDPEKNIMVAEVSSTGITETWDEKEKLQSKNTSGKSLSTSLDNDAIENLLGNSRDSEDLFASDGDNEDENKNIYEIPKNGNDMTLKESIIKSNENSKKNIKKCPKRFEMENNILLNTISNSPKKFLVKVKNDNLQDMLKQQKNVTVTKCTNSHKKVQIKLKRENFDNILKEKNIVAKSFIKPHKKLAIKLKKENFIIKQNINQNAIQNPIKDTIKDNIQDTTQNSIKECDNNNKTSIDESKTNFEAINKIKDFNVSEKDKKFFHRNDGTTSKSIPIVNTKLKKTRGQTKNEKILSSIFDFTASQSSPSNSDDPTKEMIRNLVKEGKVQTVKYKKGTGKLQTKFRNKRQRKKKQVTFEPDKNPTPVVEKENDLNINDDNYDINDDNYDNVSVYSEENMNSFNNLAKHAIINRVSKSPYSQLISNPRKIKDKKVLLALAKSFVRRSEEMQKNKQNSIKSNNVTINNNKNKSNISVQIGSTSPWRADENLPVVFNFSRNSDNLPSFSSDVLNPPLSSNSFAKRQNSRSIKNLSLNRPNKNLSLNNLKKNVSLNDSNVENMQPEIHNSKKIIETNPRKGKLHRSPLKQINIIDVINLPLLAYNNSTPIHKPAKFNPFNTFSPSKSITQKPIVFDDSIINEQSNDVVNVGDINNLFGFDKDIDDERPTSQDESISKINNSKNLLHKKLKKLKRLVPEKKFKNPNEIKRPIRFHEVNKIKSIFEDPVDSQKTMHELFSSTMKTTKKNKIFHGIHEKENFDSIDLSNNTFENQNENSSKNSKENNEKIGLFEEDNCSANNTIRTYERPKRKRPKLRHNFVLCYDSFSEEEEENEMGQPKKKTKHRKINNKHDKELESFYNDFNSLCNEVENYSIVVE